MIQQLSELAQEFPGDHHLKMRLIHHDQVVQMISSEVHLTVDGILLEKVKQMGLRCKLN
jgi:hypothetical protein